MLSDLNATGGSRIGESCPRPETQDVFLLEDCGAGVARCPAVLGSSVTSEQGEALSPTVRRGGCVCVCACVFEGEGEGVCVCT